VPNRRVRSAGVRPADRRWTALVVIAVAQLMTALDATIVTSRCVGAAVAGVRRRRPAVGDHGVHADVRRPAAARRPDRRPVRAQRSFLAGLVGFAAASALAGAAPRVAVLIAGRALQGAFAALLAPTALSLIAVTFRDAKERGTAFAVYGAVASSGAVVRADPRRRAHRVPAVAVVSLRQHRHRRRRVRGGNARCCPTRRPGPAAGRRSPTRP